MKIIVFTFEEFVNGVIAMNGLELDKAMAGFNIGSSKLPHITESEEKFAKVFISKVSEMMKNSNMAGYGKMVDADKLTEEMKQTAKDIIDAMKDQKK